MLAHLRQIFQLNVIRILGCQKQLDPTCFMSLMSVKKNELSKRNIEELKLRHKETNLRTNQGLENKFKNKDNFFPCSLASVLSQFSLSFYPENKVIILQYLQLTVPIFIDLGSPIHSSKIDLFLLFLYITLIFASFRVI